MADITMHYIGTGKSLVYNWSVAYTIFWKDFNPRRSDIPDRPADFDTDARVSWETSFDLNWFQVGNEVCFCLPIFYITWLSWVTITYEMAFQKYKNWWQNAGWTDSFTDTYSAEAYWKIWWYYVGIDDDEIWTDATRYRFLFTATWWWVSRQFTAEFTVSNLSFDSTLHPSGYMWVDGLHLYFTDGTHWSSGYKHRINYDSSYTAVNVWTDGNSWCIWLPDSSNDNHIYYIDQYWYKRRTNTSQTWFDENNQSAWSGNKWFMWVSNGGMNDWYGHLCYVNSVGFKRRITNWWVT